MQQYIALLQRRPLFFMLWLAQLTSLLGSWFSTISLVVIINRLEGTGTAVAAYFIVRSLPPFLLSPIAGVVADRFNKKHILAFSNLLRAGVVLGFLFIKSSDQLWLLYCLVFIQFTLAAFFDPTLSAIIPGFVEKEELPTANTLLSATWSAMLTLGAAIGGLITQAFGVSASLVIDSITLIVAGLIILQIKMPAEQAAIHVRASGIRDFVDGMAYVKGKPVVALLTTVKALQQIGAVDVMFAVYAARVFTLGENGALTIGLLYAVHGVGAVAGPIITNAFGDETAPYLEKAITAGYALIPVAWLLFGVAPALWVALMGMLLRGMGGSINWTYSSALLQMRVPYSFLGRVFALDFALFTLGITLASWGTGVLLDQFGVTPRTASLWFAAASLLPLFLWAWAIGRVRSADDVMAATPVGD